MGRFDGVLLASDFDDTLCDGASNAIPPRSLAALHAFMAEGGHFLVATGRAHRTFAPWADSVPMNAPAVLSNGAAIYDFATDQILWQSFLRPEAEADVLALCEVFPELGFEAYHGEDIYVHNPNEATEAHMKKVGAAYTRAPIPEMPKPWTKILFQQSHEYLERVEAHVLQTLGEHYECIFSSRRLLELTDKGSTKGQAVLRVAERLGISQQHIYCVGDNPNDVPMLALSAIPFAPGNASSEVKEVPGVQIVSPCAAGAIADVIDALSAIYR